MRYLATVIVLCVLVGSAGSQEKAKDRDLWPDDFEIGQVGYLKIDPAGKVFFGLKVLEVIDGKEMVLWLQGCPDAPFIAKGKATKGIADGKTIMLREKWKVTDTKKYKGRTYYVVEPAEDDKKK